MSNGGIIGPVIDPTSGSTAAAQITNFTSSGTYNPRAGQTIVDLIVIAGGGGGAGSTHNGGGCSGGGGGGLREVTSHPIPASPVTVTVGGGGSGGGGGGNGRG